MSQTDETIEQLRFLAENWHRFSNWTRLQIIVTIWWFVKIQYPLHRMGKRLGLPGIQIQSQGWLMILLLFSLSFITLALSATRVQPQLSLFLALISTGLLFGLVLVENRKS